MIEPVSLDARLPPEMAAKAEQIGVKEAGMNLNLLPVTPGNIIGGAVLVGSVYWCIYQHGRQHSDA